MKAGPTVKTIPQQTYKVCHGCIYLNSSGMMYGSKTVTKNHTCIHPDFKDESGLFSNQNGRQIHFNHEGDCTTPDWCPFLKHPA